MTEYRGISGTYSDFKLVKTRGVVQVIVEFPIEEANQVLESLDGLPMPGQEAHVSLGLRSKLMEIAEGKATGPERHANLSLVGPVANLPVGAGETAPMTKVSSSKQRYAEADKMKQARARAGIYPDDAQFVDWARRDCVAAEYEWKGAIQFIRDWIGGSRSLIATDQGVYGNFLDLEAKFLPAVGRIAENRG
jgi:hypothetical protein